MNAPATTSAPLGATVPTHRIARAAQLANEAANEAAMLEEHCSWAHGDFDGPNDVPRAQVMAELHLLRQAICRLGWMADRTSELLGGDICKGGNAEAWLLSPLFNELSANGGAE